MLLYTFIKIVDNLFEVKLQKNIFSFFWLTKKIRNQHLSSALMMKLSMMKTKLRIRLVEESRISLQFSRRKKKRWSVNGLFFNSMTKVVASKTKRHNQIVAQHSKLLKSRMLTKRHENLKTYHSIEFLSSNSSSQCEFYSHRQLSTAS